MLPVTCPTLENASSIVFMLEEHENAFAVKTSRSSKPNETMLALAS